MFIPETVLMLTLSCLPSTIIYPGFPQENFRELLALTQLLGTDLCLGMITPAYGFNSMQE